MFWLPSAVPDMRTINFRLTQAIVKEIEVNACAQNLHFVPYMYTYMYTLFFDD